MAMYDLALPMGLEKVLGNRLGQELGRLACL